MVAKSSSGFFVLKSFFMSVFSVASFSSCFSFDFPIVSHLSSFNVPGYPNRSITVFGHNFGSSGHSPSSRFAYTASTHSLWISDSSISSLVAPGECSQLRFVASIQSLVVSNPKLTFSYDFPAISSLKPSKGATSGGWSVTIYGSGFGTHLEFINASIGLSKFGLTSYFSDTAIVGVTVPGLQNSVNRRDSASLSVCQISQFAFEPGKFNYFDEATVKNSNVTGSFLQNFVAGTPRNVSIVGLNIFAEPRTDGGDFYYILVTGPYDDIGQSHPVVVSEVPVQDLKNGQYTANATLTISGSYVVDIFLGITENANLKDVYTISGLRQLVKQSKIRVEPAELANVSIPFGTAFATMTAGVQQQLFVQARDRYGNNRTITSDSERFNFLVSGPFNNSALNFQDSRSSELYLNRDNQIGQVSCAEKSPAFAHKSITCSRGSLFTIRKYNVSQSQDAQIKNSCCGNYWSLFNASNSNQTNQTAQVSWNLSRGIFFANTIFTASGTYVIHPLLDGVIFSQHPHTSKNILFSSGVDVIVKPGKVCGSASQISSVSIGTAGIEHKFLVLSKDEYGNYRTQGNDTGVSLSLLGPYSFEIRNQTFGEPASEGQNSSVVSWKTSITDSDGIYTFRSNATISGFYKYHVFLDSVHVSTINHSSVPSLTSPFDFHILPLDIHPYNNKFLPGERIASGANRLVDVQTTVTVATYDVFGNRRIVAGNMSAWLLIKGNFPGPITRRDADGAVLDNSKIAGIDNKDGSYSFYFTLSSADECNFTAAFAGSNSSDSPLMLKFFKNLAVRMDSRSNVKFSKLVPSSPSIGRRLLQEKSWTLGILVQIISTGSGNITCFFDSNNVNGTDSLCVHAHIDGKISIIGGGFPANQKSSFVNWKTGSNGLVMIIAIRNAKALSIFVSNAPTAQLEPPFEEFTSQSAPPWTADGANVQIGFTGMTLRLMRILASDRAQAVKDSQKVLGGSSSATSLPVSAVTYTAEAVDTDSGIKSSVQLRSSFPVGGTSVIKTDSSSVIVGSIIAEGVNLPLISASVSFVRPSFSYYSGGQSVTIFGSDFLNSTGGRCAFGALHVPFTFVNEFEVVCKTPRQLVPGLVRIMVTNEIFVSPAATYSEQNVQFFYQESSLRIGQNEAFILPRCPTQDLELSRLFICAWVRVSQKSSLSQLFVANGSSVKVPVTPNPVAEASTRHVLDANKWYSVGWRLEKGVSSFSSTFYVSDEQASTVDSVATQDVCAGLGFSPSSSSGLTMDIDEVSVYSGSSVSSCISKGIRRNTIDTTAVSNVFGVYHFDGGDANREGKESGFGLGDVQGADAPLQDGYFKTLPSGDFKGFQPIFSTSPWNPAIIQSVSPSSSPPQGGDRITLFGLNFADSSFARCVFGEVLVNPVAGSFTEGSVVCESPPQSPAIIRLTFSNNCTGKKVVCPLSDSFVFFLVGDNSLVLSTGSNFTIPYFPLNMTASGAFAFTSWFRISGSHFTNESIILILRASFTLQILASAGANDIRLAALVNGVSIPGTLTGNFANEWFFVYVGVNAGQLKMMLVHNPGCQLCSNSTCANSNMFSQGSYWSCDATDSVSRASHVSASLPNINLESNKISVVVTGVSSGLVYVDELLVYSNTIDDITLKSFFSTTIKRSPPNSLLPPQGPLAVQYSFDVPPGSETVPSTNAGSVKALVGSVNSSTVPRPQFFSPSDVPWQAPYVAGVAADIDSLGGLVTIRGDQISPSGFTFCNLAIPESGGFKSLLIRAHMVSKGEFTCVLPPLQPYIYQIDMCHGTLCLLGMFNRSFEVYEIAASCAVTPKLRPCVAVNGINISTVTVAFWFSPSLLSEARFLGDSIVLFGARTSKGVDVELIYTWTNLTEGAIKLLVNETVMTTPPLLCVYHSVSMQFRSDGLVSLWVDSTIKLDRNVSPQISNAMFYNLSFGYFKGNLQVETVTLDEIKIWRSSVSQSNVHSELLLKSQNTADVYIPFKFRRFVGAKLPVLSGAVVKSSSFMSRHLLNVAPTVSLTDNVLSQALGALPSTRAVGLSIFPSSGVSSGCVEVTVKGSGFSRSSSLVIRYDDARPTFLCPIALMLPTQKTLCTCSVIFIDTNTIKLITQYYVVAPMTFSVSNGNNDFTKIVPKFEYLANIETSGSVPYNSSCTIQNPFDNTRNATYDCQVEGLTLSGCGFDRILKPGITIVQQCRFAGTDSRGVYQELQTDAQILDSQRVKCPTRNVTYPGRFEINLILDVNIYQVPGGFTYFGRAIRLLTEYASRLVSSSVGNVNASASVSNVTSVSLKLNSEDFVQIPLVRATLYDAADNAMIWVDKNLWNVSYTVRGPVRNVTARAEQQLLEGQTVQLGPLFESPIIGLYTLETTVTTKLKDLPNQDYILQHSILFQVVIGTCRRTLACFGKLSNTSTSCSVASSTYRSIALVSVQPFYVLLLDSGDNFVPLNSLTSIQLDGSPHNPANPQSVNARSLCPIDRIEVQHNISVQKPFMVNITSDIVTVENQIHLTQPRSGTYAVFVSIENWFSKANGDATFVGIKDNAAKVPDGKARPNIFRLLSNLTVFITAGKPVQMNITHKQLEVRCQERAWPGVFDLSLYDAGFNLVLEDEDKNVPSSVNVSAFDTSTPHVNHPLVGNLTATFSRGHLTFDDFYLVMPPKGKYSLRFRHAYSYVASSDITIEVLPGAPVSIRVLSMRTIFEESFSIERDDAYPQVMRLVLQLLDGSGTQIDRPAQLEFIFDPPAISHKTNATQSPDAVAVSGLLYVDVFFKLVRSGSPYSLFIIVNMTKSRIYAKEKGIVPFDVFDKDQRSASIIPLNYLKFVVDSNFGHPSFPWNTNNFVGITSDLDALELCDTRALVTQRNSGNVSKCVHRIGTGRVISSFPNSFAVTEIEKISAKTCDNATQFPTDTGICACKATFYRSKMENFGTSEECQRCEISTFRSPPNPWVKDRSFTESQCEDCPASFIIENPTDRHTYKNCKCPKDHFFQYNNDVVVNPKKKRGICPYSEIVYKQNTTALCSCQPCSKQDPESPTKQSATYCTGGYFGLQPGFSVLKSHMLGPADADIAALISGNISDQVYKCKRSEACINNGTCDESIGYTGVLCAECVPGFGLMAQNKCGKCLPESLNRLVVSIMAIGMLFLVVFLAYGSKAPASDLSAIQKILVNHLSFLSFLGQMDLSWPDIFQDIFFQSAAYASDVSTASPIDCVFVGDFKSKFFVWMSFPVIGLLIPVVFNTVQYQASRQLRRFAGKSSFVESFLGSKSTRIIMTEATVDNSARMPAPHAVAFANRNRVLRASQDDDDARELRINSLLIFFVSLYFFYPMLTKMIFDAINVWEIRPLSEVPEVVISRLAAIPSVDTTQFDYKSIIFPLAILFLIIYGFCIPIALVLAMRWKQEARLGGGSMTIIFNFMTQGYRFETYYWESYVMVRKLVISAIISFLGGNTVYQSYGLLGAMVVNLLMTIFLRPFKAWQGFSLDVASTTVLHVTILAGIVITQRLPNKSAISTIFQEPVLGTVIVVALIANFAIILVLFSYVVYDKLNGKEFRGVPVILYFRFYSRRVREEIMQLQNSHANFIASLESKHYNKLSFNKFIAVTAKEGNAFRRAYHKNQTIAQALREKELADISYSREAKFDLDEELGRRASSSSSELTVTPTHSSPTSDTQSKSGSDSGSMSTESSDAHLSDSDDSQRPPVRMHSALLHVPQLAFSSGNAGKGSITSSSEILEPPPLPVQKQSSSSVAMGSWHSASQTQDTDLKASVSAVPNLRSSLASASRRSAAVSVSTAPPAARSFVAAASPPTPRVENPTVSSAARPLVPHFSPRITHERPALKKFSNAPVESPRVTAALVANRSVNNANEIIENPTVSSVARPLVPQTTLERPASNKLSNAPVVSLRVNAALVANRRVNIGASPRQSAFGANEPAPARQLPQISDTGAVTSASATMSFATVPPMQSRSSTSSLDVVPAAPNIETPRHMPLPPPLPVHPLPPLDIPPPPFPSERLTLRDMPPPLPRDARNKSRSDGSSAISSVRDASPPPPVRLSPPPFSPPMGRRSNSQSASALQRDEPPPLPPVARAAREH
jgi:hypothetical protein